MSDAAHATDHRPTTKRTQWLRITAWVLAGLAFIAGPIIGTNINAQVGAGVWISSAILALAPFASHRNKDRFR